MESICNSAISACVPSCDPICKEIKYELSSLLKKRLAGHLLRRSQSGFAGETQPAVKGLAELARKGLRG